MLLKWFCRHADILPDQISVCMSHSWGLFLNPSSACCLCSFICSVSVGTALNGPKANRKSDLTQISGTCRQPGCLLLRKNRNLKYVYTHCLHVCVCVDMGMKQKQSGQQAGVRLHVLVEVGTCLWKTWRVGAAGFSGSLLFRGHAVLVRGRPQHWVLSRTTDTT